MESGEQPGKVIHEFRPTGHERLTKRPFKPWYVYSDSVMRNYDSVDSTPLYLIAAYRYWKYTGDNDFIDLLLPGVKDCLAWLEKYSDSNNDGLVDYYLSPKRVHGGLISQNWMDSVESVFHETEGLLVYPMAPVEVQAYTYLAYRLWSEYFANRDQAFKQKLDSNANNLKELFNKKYPLKDPDGHYYLAFKIDGNGVLFKSVRSNMGHCLWASMNVEDDGKMDSIVYAEYIPQIVNRLMMPDMFEPKAGIRTLSRLSKNFKPNSYHNGSIWPHDNAIIAEGFWIHGFKKEAKAVKSAILTSIKKFNTPIELFTFFDGKYSEFISDDGHQTSCKYQAWTAASILDLATNYK